MADLGARPGEEDSEIIVDFGDGTYCGPRIATDGLLLNADGG